MSAIFTTATGKHLASYHDSRPPNPEITHTFDQTGNFRESRIYLFLIEC
jgi:hypothetical protein